MFITSKANRVRMITTVVQMGSDLLSMPARHQEGRRPSMRVSFTHPFTLRRKVWSQLLDHRSDHFTDMAKSAAFGRRTEINSPQCLLHTGGLGLICSRPWHADYRTLMYRWLVSCWSCNARRGEKWSSRATVASLSKVHTMATVIGVWLIKFAPSQ